MKKRILGLKIDTNRISWAIVEENISDLPHILICSMKLKKTNTL
jgi:CRISPR/Cas system Type II protein with McrA/HNH and RuvC-like nuclease domain